ncbi:transmembrane sensor [Sphingomonas zeicaulis]|uniref:FecR family protein n=1 Tax=Sphingomonas zeicaulis TaxID=1632740 RepID=UPI003D19107B
MIPNDREDQARIDEASEWFARMRGPEADAARSAFAAWQADPLNAAAYTTVEKTWQKTAIGRWSKVGRTRDLRRAAVRRGRWLYAAAALFAMLIFGSVLLINTRSSSSKPVAYATRIGEVRRIRLADGSQVILDAGTRVDVRFSSNERRIALMAGRARFAVAHDARRPFVVAAAGHVVTARGTVFDVAIGADMLRVALIDGVVDVGAADKHVVRLAPGLMLQAATGAGAPAISPMQRDATAWTAGRLSYTATPLSVVIADVRRYSRRRIRLADPALASRRVTGRFRAQDGEAIIARLAEALELDREETDEELVLRSRSQR